MFKQLIEIGDGNIHDGDIIFHQSLMRAEAKTVQTEKSNKERTDTQPLMQQQLIYPSSSRSPLGEIISISSGDLGSASKLLSCSYS
jgi:hypothetical protein